MNKWLYFDFEIGFESLLPADLMLLESGEVQDIWEMWPFGVSVAGVKLSDEDKPFVLYDKRRDGKPANTWKRDFSQEFVDYLWEANQGGYEIVTWNGLGFDFRLLYELTRDERVKSLALAHYDPCFIALCQLGYPVGLGSATKLVGGPEKEMSGASAPLMWLLKNHIEVIQYVEGDVIRLEQIWTDVLKRGGLAWATNSGGLRLQPYYYGLPRVVEAAQFPLPDNSWMDEPMTRKDFTGWIYDGH